MYLYDKRLRYNVRWKWMNIKMYACFEYLFGMMRKNVFKGNKYQIGLLK